jgi:Bacterial Ig domain/Fibronectin type III domain
MRQRWWVIGWVVLIGWLLLLGSTLWAATVMLAWDASQGAQGYELHYGLAPGSYTNAVDTGMATTAAVSGLTTGLTYYFAVLAYNAVGDSPFSNEVSVVPSDPPGDTTPPLVNITSPGNGVVPRNQNVTITADASDNVAVVDVTITVKNASNQVIKTCGDTSAPYQCLWAVPAPPNRTYTIQGSAKDAANNTGQSAIVQVTSQ